MKPKGDDAIAEVRNARKALCDRFGNDPNRLLAHLRAEQRNHQGRIIKNWSVAQPEALRCQSGALKAGQKKRQLLECPEKLRRSAIFAANKPK